MTYREKMIHALKTVPVHDGVIRMSEEVRDKIVELLKEQPQWISVEGRLPEEHESMFYKLLGTPKWSNSMWKQESEKVLVYVSFPDETGVVTTGCLHNSDWVTTVSKTLPQTVTHWMPLPEPPQEGN